LLTSNNGISGLIYSPEDRVRAALCC